MKITSTPDAHILMKPGIQTNQGKKNVVNNQRNKSTVSSKELELINLSNTENKTSSKVGLAAIEKVKDQIARGEIDFDMKSLAETMVKKAKREKL